jgi:hypothetical protein
LTNQLLLQNLVIESLYAWKPDTRIRQAFLVVLKDKPVVDKGLCRTVPSTALRGDWNNLLTMVRYIYLRAYMVANQK